MSVFFMSIIFKYAEIYTNKGVYNLSVKCITC